MEKDTRQAGGETALSDIFAERRAILARLYGVLPTYGSADFWTRLEGPQKEEEALPLEVLIKVLREEALPREDRQAQYRLFEVIVARLQSSNEQWVHQVLTRAYLLLPDERHALAADLYADLCEQLLRSFLDTGQHFWQVSFQHALHFARKHVYASFMRREGRWHKLTPGPGYRVPHRLLESLERFERQAEFEDEREMPDERAELALLAVEQADITDLLLRLPVRLRTIVWLIFWEDCSTKTVGQLLNISDRTVRNQLQIALAQLRKILEDEQEVVDGASA